MWRSRCQQCLRTGDTALCEQCWQQIAPLPEPAYRLTDSHPHIAYAAYASPLKQLLYAIKYDQARELAFALGVHLGHWYLQRWPRPDVLVPIPLHAERQASRGYNQAEEIARGLAEVLQRPCRPLLKRRRDTPALHALNPAERQAVLQDAFALNGQPATGQRLLLIDDIVTTGSTLLQAAETLAPHHPRLVSLTLARALLAEL